MCPPRGEPTPHTTLRRRRHPADPTSRPPQRGDNKFAPVILYGGISRNPLYPPLLMVVYGLFTSVTAGGGVLPSVNSPAPLGGYICKQPPPRAGGGRHGGRRWRRVASGGGWRRGGTPNLLFSFFFSLSSLTSSLFLLLSYFFAPLHHSPAPPLRRRGVVVEGATLTQPRPQACPPRANPQPAP